MVALFFAPLLCYYFFLFCGLVVFRRVDSVHCAVGCAGKHSRHIVAHAEWTMDIVLLLSMEDTDNAGQAAAEVETGGTLTAKVTFFENFCWHPVEQSLLEAIRRNLRWKSFALQASPTTEVDEETGEGVMTFSARRNAVVDGVLHLYRDKVPASWVTLLFFLLCPMFLVLR